MKNNTGKKKAGNLKDLSNDAVLQPSKKINNQASVNKRTEGSLNEKMETLRKMHEESNKNVKRSNWLNFAKIALEITKQLLGSDDSSD
jgi:hypothetical protein